MQQSIMADVELKRNFSAEQLEVPCQKIMYLEDENELSNKN